MFNTHMMDYHDVLYRHSLSPQDDLCCIGDALISPVPFILANVVVVKERTFLMLTSAVWSKKYLT